MKNRREDKKKEMAELRREKNILEKRVRELELVEDQFRVRKVLKAACRKNSNLVIANSKLWNRIRDLEDQLREARHVNAHQAEDLQILKDQADESETEEASKIFPTKTCLLIYRMLMSNVPVGQVGPLLQFMAKHLAGRLLPNIPTPAIVARMTTELRVLGLFGKVLAEPWMKKFYGNEDGIAHLEMRQCVMESVKCMERLQEDPSSLHSCMLTAFGDEFPSGDEVFACLRNCGSLTPVECDIVVVVSKALLECINNQLRRYISGDLSVSLPELVTATASAPLNNIACIAGVGPL